ncbi:MAG: CDP-alcohol phosphatidyltransferase family protein [Xanthomonadales bacterium]|nr:CDP-alcohol phosphatidyltransferase family protein [Xanthomonadales bacterium]
MTTVLRHLPNTITVARILACPLLAWLIIADQARTALWLAVAVGISDVVDGFLARRFNWQSRLGGLLDPIADKLFLVSAMIALGVTGALPAWLIVLVVVRDLVIVGGAFVYHYRVETLNAAPSVLGKLNTLLQVALVLTALASQAGVPVPAWLLAALVVAVALLAVVSGGQYVLVWSARARAAWRNGRSS